MTTKLASLLAVVAWTVGSVPLHAEPIENSSVAFKNPPAPAAPVKPRAVIDAMVRPAGNEAPVSAQAVATDLDQSEPAPGATVNPDPAAAFFHQGEFTHRDEQGRVIASGAYQEGKRQGKWTRWFYDNEPVPLSGAVSDEFTWPLVSEVTFVDGQPQGIWTIVDSEGRPIGKWELNVDRPNGTSVWWHPNGQKMREVQYSDGLVEGTFNEWKPDGEQTITDKYYSGRRMVTRTELHAPKKKRLEGSSLLPGQVSRASCDWWSGAVTIDKVGDFPQEDKHGVWTWWYPDGHVQMQGTYHEGVLSGKFVWWYPNNQKQLEGTYRDGKQDGHWTWYYTNGMRHYRGEFVAGEQTGKWARYREDGTLQESQLHEPGTETEVIGTASPNMREPEKPALRPRIETPEAETILR